MDETIAVGTGWTLARWHGENGNLSDVVHGLSFEHDRIPLFTRIVISPEHGGG
jgi:hypothetical protein